MSKPSGHLASEEVLNKKLDLCISNAIVKTGIGFSAGVVLSVVLLKRRSWPVWLGTGFGLGAGYTDCERSFNPVAVPGVRVIPSSAAANVPDTQMGKIQQRVGELFGQAKEETEQKVPTATQNIRDQVQNRFAELTNKGRDAVEQQVSNLQDAANDVASKFQEKTQDLTDAVKQTEQKTEDKVRRI
ncbi:Mitochondrial inner membrane organizing system component [Malassezia brasiliensis]|uniref:MICOS complex subunit MIC10 n=1 Tax=Malassezia brasiliensis TaxID=1821822 RepID=A0AAF0DRX9_9BASI|nr:Mitochondrial inner membrane organizing system component [Malassezia brasiliensis]